MSARRAAFVAVLVGVLTAGCGAGAELRGAMSATATPTPESPSAPVEAVPGAAGPAGPCRGDGLAVSLGPTTDAGDSVAQDLILQNTGTAACVLRGYPLVVAVAGNEGTPVGGPALPVGARGEQVRLEPRGAATVPLRVRDTSAYDGRECRPQPVRGLQVRPPGGSGPVFVPREGTACAAGSPEPPWATVGTVVAR